MIDEEEDEEILNKKTSGKSILKTLFVLALVVLGAVIIYVGVFPENQYLNFALGFIVICIGTSIVQMPSKTPEPVKQTLSIINCESCGATTVRDYQNGDFVYKDQGKCNKCSRLMSIKQIYSVRLKKTKKK
ncbi:MAG: hypothetical protein JW891_03730 [Candidatus Lokiarchaeota archaeon]|nr:hypothetical protein [Candidatus Lokiarchaeota archaeon]